MAYSDYGGYGYRNGLKVVERSDAVLTPEGLKSTPGMWPGFVFQEGRNGRSYHVILGDGPIFVCLYKQSSLSVHRLSEELDITSLLKHPEPHWVDQWEWKGEPRRSINVDWFKSSELPCPIEVDGHAIEARWTEEDNHYQYVRVTQPDGVVWCGWSGYGVGCGLSDYGYSDSDRDEVMRGFWPDAIKPEVAV
jgi:hypothetical protein